MNRPASLAFNLFAFWQSVTPGVGVTMQEMVTAMNVSDPQVIRNALVQVRQGRVPDPSARGSYLRPLPIRYNPDDGLYYDMSNLTGEAVANQVPGNAMAFALDHLLARARTIDASMGPDGLAKSARDLLNDQEARLLISQLPMDRIWELQDLIGHVARARQMLELEQRSALPSPTHVLADNQGDSTADNGAEEHA